MNNLRHGRYANHAIVLSNEDPAAFEDLANAYIRRIGPLDSVEARLARELAGIDWRLDRNRAMETRMFDHEMDIQAPMLEATNRRVHELTRLYLAANSLLANSRLPNYLARRESALLAARRKTLSALDQLRKMHPISAKATQIIEPTPLNPENDPRNEPDSNPTGPLNSNKTRAAICSTNPRQTAIVPTQTAHPIPWTRFRATTQQCSRIPPEFIRKVPLAPGKPGVSHPRMVDHSWLLTATPGSPIYAGLLS